MHCLCDQWKLWKFLIFPGGHWQSPHSPRFSCHYGCAQRLWKSLSVGWQKCPTGVDSTFKFWQPLSTSTHSHTRWLRKMELRFNFKDPERSQYQAPITSQHWFRWWLAGVHIKPLDIHAHKHMILKIYVPCKNVSIIKTNGDSFTYQSLVQKMFLYMRWKVLDSASLCPQMNMWWATPRLLMHVH